MEWIKHETWVLAETGFQISKHPHASKYMILDPSNACLGIVDSLADAQEAAGRRPWPCRTRELWRP